MNLFSRLLLLIIFLAPVSASAVDVGAFYFASCKRHLGVILEVDSQNIQLVTLEGDLVVLPRYEIIYWATYPLEDFAIPLGKKLGDVSRLKVYTRQSYTKVLLVEGWPVDFTEDRISFLTPGGSRQVIDSDSIWEIDRIADPVKEDMPTTSGAASWNFVHPPVFRGCEQNIKATRQAYPEQILSDPVAIKRELDRLQQGHRKVEKFESRQKFYPVPQLYKNRTYLGLWHMFGSRYGSSSSRTNNFTPVLVDQTSKGPFGFQQEITTGAAPIYQTVHEETQVSFYYRFKADYFHFSAMVDPMMAFLGKKYAWSTDDFLSGDDRIVEQYFAELGFDLGHFSLELYPASAALMASRVGDRFAKGTPNLPRVGIGYRDHRLKINAQAGKALGTGFELDFRRLNLGFEINPALEVNASLISREQTYTNLVGPNAMKMISKSLTVASYVNYYFAKKFYLGSLLSRESVSHDFGFVETNLKTDNVYWKTGLNLSIGF